MFGAWVRVIYTMFYFIFKLVTLIFCKTYNRASLGDYCKVKKRYNTVFISLFLFLQLLGFRCCMHVKQTQICRCLEIKHSQFKVLSSSVFLSEIIVMCCVPFSVFCKATVSILAHTATKRHSALFEWERLHSHSLQAPPCKGVSRRETAAVTCQKLTDRQVRHTKCTNRCLPWCFVRLFYVGSNLRSLYFVSWRILHETLCMWFWYSCMLHNEWMNYKNERPQWG